MKKICKECGTVGNPTTITKGSIIIELFLWMLFLVPGVLYSLWRLTTRCKACPQCSGEMIPMNSPMGQKLMNEIRSKK